ncbi:substrate-binding domain-containing protein [Imtechella halotolerans]|uniref:Ca3427-like PBP 2 domain-containing protein n=1 Tax=Imtechella halotolerans K1 TaxID=946077 RepID=I0W703_9FLAO|nr:substrate-binding domain-containing protein [Imtechella halotolerans]EID72169.1 hypothetical protein W5A_11716 [Imtechella halotolerans K1]WMQ64272.1 substrate-binding domain-containing protein [Imtechella halotolerans]
MKSLRVAGVPEHFNLPWHLADEEGAFESAGIDLQWIDVPEGTGKMCQMLREDETDMAVILTEGIIKDICDGNPSSIVQTYVESPLSWGIHVGSQSNLKNSNELENATVAISRKGSGSHLMAIVHAQSKGWDTNKMSFEIINNLDGAVSKLPQDANLYFMWERFMTKPLVDKGIFKHLGDFPTPWPCFVIAVRSSFLAENKAAVKHVLSTINRFTQEFKSIPSIDRTLANRYEQQLDDIRIWLRQTTWSQKQLSMNSVAKVQQALLDLKLISAEKPYSEIVTNL